MMEIFNSFWIVVLFLALWIPWLWWLKRRHRKACAQCGGRDFTEVGKKPAGLVHSDNQFTAKTGVAMDVTYRCQACGARTTEREFRD